MTFLLTTFLFAFPGGWEWIVIVFAILLLFGGKKIPELMRGLGKGIREFNTARSNIQSEIEHGMKEKDAENQSGSTNDQAQNQQSQQNQQSHQQEQSQSDSKNQ